MSQKIDVRNNNRGRKLDQKMKPVLVYLYLLQQTDNEHFETGEAIADYLNENFNISAERRSIYRDIKEMNKALLAFREGITYEEAESILEEDESQKTIKYQPKKGFYVAQRQFEEEDIRLLAECVYTAKFITEKQTNTLLDILSQFLSEYQAERLRHDAFLADRSKTSNAKTLDNIQEIQKAMSRNLNGQQRIPTQISFKYLKYEISNLNQQVERKQGAKYVVSPYHFIIADGYYYLLAYDSSKQKMMTYRIDRMRDVKITGIPRDGEKDFNSIDLNTYTTQHFGMFGGEAKFVTIRVISSLLDTMVDRFGNGKQNAIYTKVDDSHFNITVKVDVSNQFFGWLLGFGKKVKLISPDDVVEKFEKYISSIHQMYQKNDSP